MSNIDKKLLLAEVERLGHISHLSLDPAQAERLASDIAAILEYTQQLDELTEGQAAQSNRLINVFREDKVVIQDSSELLERAPQSRGNYFVVPKIIKQD